MADTLQTEIAVTFGWALADTTDAISTPRDQQIIASQYSWPDGTGENAADQVWRDTRELAAGTSELLDLASTVLLAGSIQLKDVFGNVMDFARVKALLVQNTHATRVLTIGNGPATTWVGPFGALTHTISVEPGGIILLVAPLATGWPVGAGATDQLKIAVAAGGVGNTTYKIAIIGASA